MYFDDEREPYEVQLHVLCDASESAYGCVAYLRYTYKPSEHRVAFVMAKSRVAPIRTVTLARLELGSTRLGARLGHYVRHEMDLPIQRIQYWSDSTIALQYINNDTLRMKVYVANRVSEILELSSRSEWRHIPGDINTADILTRGVKTRRI